MVGDGDDDDDDECCVCFVVIVCIACWIGREWDVDVWYNIIWMLRLFFR